MAHSDRACWIIALITLIFAAACSEPTPVRAEYTPTDCPCEEPSATDDGAAPSAAAQQAEPPPEAPASAEAQAEGLAEADAAVDATVDDEAAPAEAAPEQDDAPIEVAAIIVGDRIDINTAGISELMQLPGVGPSIAARIVEFRKTHPFDRPEHLMRVRGIGPKTFSKLSARITTR